MTWKANDDVDSLSIYPNTEVRVEKVQFSVLHLKRLYEDRKELILSPDFQRKDVWKGKQRSELIESILMGIPIPIMFLFETANGRKQVVDGRQRITTIIGYLNNEFLLRDLKILHDLNGSRFRDLDTDRDVLPGDGLGHLRDIVVALDGTLHNEVQNDENQ
jgi:hypothetical protein